MAISKKKICRFCDTRDLESDYKDVKMLRKYITDQGKIIPRIVSGNCERHQREMTTAINRSSNISLIPYSVTAI